jgi:hypothetical protein
MPKKADDMPKKADDTFVWLDLKGDVMQCVYKEKMYNEKRSNVYSRLCKLACAVFVHFHGLRVDA